MMANDGEKVKAYVEVVAAYVRQDLTLRQQKSAFDTALAFATQHLFRDQLNPAECGNSGLSNERCVVSTYWEYVRLMDKFLANVESRGGYVPKNGPRFELITTALKAAQAIGEFASLAQDFRRYGAPDRLFKLVDDAAAIKERDARCAKAPPTACPAPQCVVGKSFFTRQPSCAGRKKAGGVGKNLRRRLCARCSVRRRLNE